MTMEKLDTIFRKFFEKNVALNDDIFDLGGTSLTAIQIVTEVNKEFSVDLDMEIFFLKPSKQTIVHYLNERNSDVVEI